MNFLADMIRSVIEDMGDGDVSLREAYSGRGMYGRTCPGITGSMDGCMKVIGEVIKQARDASVANDDVDFDQVVDTLLDFSQDNMGRDTILYWTQLDAFEEPESGPVRDSYEDYACPDCGEEIPKGTVDGAACDNCGHVFSVQREGDDE